MLHKVGPSLFCWCYLGFFASLAWLFSCLKMDFLNKITGVVANTLVRLTIILSWFVLNVLLHKAFMFFRSQPRHARLFHGYKRLGKIVGSALLFFGNIGLYYYSEKSIACMLTFLFLALHCLCALFCIQPYTDFGVLGFLLGASLNQGLCLFGIHSYSFWFVLIACIVMVGLRYYLEPTSKFEMESNSNLTLPVQAILAHEPSQSGQILRSPVLRSSVTVENLKSDAVRRHKTEPVRRSSVTVENLKSDAVRRHKTEPLFSMVSRVPPPKMKGVSSPAVLTRKNV